VEHISEDNAEDSGEFLLFLGKVSPNLRLAKLTKADQFECQSPPRLNLETKFATTMNEPGSESPNYNHLMRTPCVISLWTPTKSFTELTHRSAQAISATKSR